MPAAALPNTATSLHKALLLLELLGRGGPMGVTELAQAAGLAPPTVHRLLAVLAQSGYARQDPASRRYHLGLKLLELGAAAQEGSGLKALAAPHMRRLAEASRETVNLVVFDRLEAVYVDQVSGASSMLRMFTKVGARAPLFCSGVGKAYLASLEERAALALFEAMDKARHTPNTIVERGPFLAEMAAIRARGYAVDDEEMEAGVRCVAALLPGPDGGTGGALSISGPGARITRKSVPRLAGLLLETIRDISGRPGGAAQP